jgi:hypothetical protein
MLVVLGAHIRGITCAYRFMMLPRKALEDELKQQEKELTDDINNLNKKVRSSRHLVVLR